MKVVVEDGVAKFLDRTAFPGSIATVDLQVPFVMKLADVAQLHSIQMITTNQTQIRRIEDRKGSPTTGKNVEIVIFDDNIQIKTQLVMNVLWQISFNTR